MGSRNKNLCNRFLKVVEFTGLKQSEFAKAVGIKQSDVSSYKSYRLEPSKTTLLNTIKKFNIDGHWLLTGEGDMIRFKNSIKDDSQYSRTYSNNNQLLEEIEKLTKENNRLKQALIRLALETPEPPDKGKF